MGWILEYLSKGYEDKFTDVSNKLGLYGVRKMSVISAAAMWSDAGVSNNTANTILTHLRHSFHYQVQVPLKQINKVIFKINKILPPVFGTYDHYKDKNESLSTKKLPEKVKYWVNDFCELLAIDVETIMNTGFYEGKTLDELHTFGQPKVDIVIGSDHGAGKSRFLMKSNLLSSADRRKNVSVKHGSRVYHFGNIDCKKDTSIIHKQLSPYINEYLKKLKGGRLIGVKDVLTSKIYVAMVPKKVLYLHTSIKNRCLYLN